MTTCIETKFLGPTNFRGSRYKAFTRGKIGDNRSPSIIIDADHRFDYTKNHVAVAFALAKKLKWSGIWIEGQTDNGSVFVRLPYGEGVNRPESAAFVVPETE